MNLTQIMVENDCIWGQVTTLGVKWMTPFESKYDSCQGQNKEMTRYRVVNDYIEGSELENDPKM